MPAAYKIEVADLKSALTTAGLDVTIGASFADTDDALYLMIRILDAFQAAQGIQNEFADTGEDVQAIIRSQNGTTTQRENPPGSGNFVNTSEVVYQLSGNIIVSTTGAVGNFV